MNIDKESEIKKGRGREIKKIINKETERATI